MSSTILGFFMALQAWYSSGREQYMSDEEKATIYGRLALEIKALDSDLGYLKAELNRIGTNFEVSGRIMRKHDGPIVLDRAAADVEVNQAFVLIDRYNRAVTAREEKQRQLDQLA